jgi:hypothetical protein
MVSVSSARAVSSSVTVSATSSASGVRVSRIAGGDLGVDAGAGYVLADRDTLADAGGLAEVVGHGGAVGAGVIPHAHPASACAAHEKALQQGWAFAGRPGFAVGAVGGGVGGQDREVGLVLLEGDVSGVGLGC